MVAAQKKSSAKEGGATFNRPRKGKIHFFEERVIVFIAKTLIEHRYAEAVPEFKAFL